MAHVPTNLRLSTTIPVDQPTVLQYTFDFAPGAGSAVVVKVNGTVIDPSRYTVQIAEGGDGGSITFLGSMQTSDPVMLAMDDVILIERDTTVQRQQTFPDAGYASAAAVELFASLIWRIAEELTARTESHARIIDEPVGLDELDETLRDWVDQSLDVNRLEWDATAEQLTLGSNDGRTEVIDLSSLGSAGDHAYTDAKARAQAVAAIAAGVEAWARQGGGDVPAARLPYATTSGEDGIVSTNDLQTLAAAQNAGQVAAAIQRAVAGFQSASDVANLINARVPNPQQGDLNSFLRATGVGRTRWVAVPDASRTDKGLVSLASPADVSAATDDTKAMTPARTAEMIHDRPSIAAVASGNTLPDKPWRVGQRFRLLRDQMLAHDPLIHTSERDDTPISNEFYLPGQLNASGPRFIRSYSDAWGRAGNPLRDKVFIDSTTRPHSGAQFVWYPANREYNAQTDLYAVADAGVPGYPRWYEIGVNAQGNAPRYAATNDEAQTGGYHVNIVNWTSGGGRLYPDDTVHADDLTFEGGDEGEAGWIRTPGVGLDREQVIALIRQLAPTESITTLHDGAGQSLNITASDTLANITYAFTNTFDLDDTANQSGLLEVEATVTMVSPSDTTLGFIFPSVYSARYTGFATAASLRALTVNNDAVAPVDGTSGVLIGSIRVRAAANNNRIQVGDLQLWIVRNAANELRYRWYWPGTRTGGYNFNFSTRLQASFIHQEAGTGGGRGSSYTQHTSLASLPTSGMVAGDLHQVVEGAGVDAAVTRFVAVDATNLKCVGGMSANLVNRNIGTPQGGTGGSPVAVGTARQWLRIPLSGTGAPYATWDYRFPLLMVSLGGRNNTGGPWNLDSTWYEIDTEVIRGLTAASAGQAQATGTFVEVGRLLGVTNTNQPIWRVVAFGRTASHEVLVNLHSTTLQAFPLRIRGKG